MSAWLLLVALASAPVALDGDTIVIDDGRHVRIANIDAPEIHDAKCDAEKRLGMVARRRMSELLTSGRVVIHPGDPVDGRIKDRYGRTLATITIDGNDVGEIMIAEGLARRWTGRRRPWCN